MSIRKIYIELTNRCNLNCSICYRQSWSEKPRDMSKDLFFRLMDEIKEMGSIKSVVLGGIGEPTCAALISEALDGLGMYDLTLTTNAVEMDKALAGKIVENVNLIMISIDGLHENYYRIRGTSLDAVIKNINSINELKKESKRNIPVLGIQFVICKDNVADVYDLIDLAHDLKVGSLVLSNLIPQVKENADKILYKRYENKEMKLLFNKVLNYSLRRGINILFPSYELKTERRCSFIDDDAVYVSASGEVVPCYRLSHSYNEYVFGREKAVIKHSFGSMTDLGLKEIWEGKEYSSFRHTVGTGRYPSCIDCDLFEGCDLVKDTIADCYAGTPSCADCLWARKFTICP